jgi:hypothetical protein
MSLSTRTIFLKLQDSPMRTFLANWVMFEELVVDIHASGKIDEEDIDLLGSLRFALKHHYRQWADVLRPYWQQVKVAGKLLRQDPFLNMLDTSVFSGQGDSYAAVETLAVVRETLNLMVSDQKI